MRARSVHTTLLAAIAVGLAGCPCGDATPILAYHFESDCADALCGFNVRTGQATRTSGIAPGEHVLQLEPGTRIEASSLNTPLTNMNGTLAVALAVRCENGAELTASVTVSETRDADGGLGTPNISVRTGVTQPGTEWQRQIVPVHSTNNNDSTTIQQATLVELALQTSSAGRCWIDDVGVSSPLYCM